jgi:biofilm PGA synthesis N-glycosyltransferase PgaC
VAGRRKSQDKIAHLKTMANPSSSISDRFNTRAMPTYALITPAHNEEQFIGEMIASVMRQTPRPAKWIIVDDGSTDGTWDVIQYLNVDRMIEVIRLPPKETRAPGGEGAITRALNRLNLADYDFLARFDADIILGNGYMAGIFSEFAKDPQLGIAGGSLYIRTPKGEQLEEQPPYHVRGALKLYRTKCFTDIGGLVSHIGWDTMDETCAQIRGWSTKNLPQYHAIHCRPTGTGISSVHQFWEQGRAEYFTWSDPLFVLLKSLKVAFLSGGPISALAYLGSFATCYAKKQTRISDERFRKFRRRNQRARMFPFLNPNFDNARKG